MRPYILKTTDRGRYCDRALDVYVSRNVAGPFVNENYPAEGPFEKQKKIREYLRENRVQTYVTGNTVNGSKKIHSSPPRKKKIYTPAILFRKPVFGQFSCPLPPPWTLTTAVRLYHTNTHTAIVRGTKSEYYPGAKFGPRL